MSNYVTVNITKELHDNMKQYMKEKGVKSFSWLIQKMFEQYTRKR